MNATTPFPWPTESAERGLPPLFAYAPVGVARCTRQGNITAVNPALERMLGGPLARPSRFSDLVGPEDRAETEQLFRELSNGERTSFQVERPAPGEPGCTGWLKWTAWRVAGLNGEPDYVLGMAQETTANPGSHRSLRQAQKFESVGRMAGGIAHDFNNLVTGVLLYSDLLLAEMEEGTRWRSYVEEIRVAGIQAADVVRQLLAATRPREATSIPLSLNVVIEAMRDLLVRLVGENNTLHFNLDPTLGHVKLLPAQVQQILLNLVLNARDAIAGGGRIAIETTSCKVQIVAESGNESLDEAVFAERPSAALPCAIFSVSDNGTGMDAETQEHLFEPFFTTKAPDKGTGLGLATVHEIVTSNGGLIYVDSAPGRGTRVTVLLPLVPESTTQCRSQTIETTGHEGAPPQPEKEITS